MMEINKLEEQKEKRFKKSEQSLRHLWTTTKRTKIPMVGVPERKEREEGRENI